MMDETRFKKLLEDAGLGRFSPLYPALSRYCDLLLDWNTRMNLTAIREPDAVMEKHFIDSLLPLSLVELPQGASLVDVGTGAGFPGLPMKLARPDLRLTLLDSLQKRLTFLEAVCGELETEARLVHARAEDAGRDPAHRERYDVAVSRAVAGLGALAEYCLPLVRAGGVVLALKGSSGREEAAQGERAVAVCGGRIREVLTYSLPGGDARTLVVLEKISQTPTKYPRTATKIAKNPL